MKKKTNPCARYLLILVAVLGICQTYSCSPKYAHHLDGEQISAWMKSENVPTVGVCLIENSKVRSVQMFGDIKHHSPAPPNTLFNIASLTKPLIALTTLKLVSDGQWQLDEPLSNFWIDPDIAEHPFAQKLTTRLVLSHQTGLPNWRGHETDGKLSFAFEPGTQYKYSGEGFECLRKALEVKTNMPIEMLVDSILFQPLGMKDTRFFWDEKMDTTLYADRYDANGLPYEFENWHSANAANLVLSTVSDYGKFGAAVLRGDFLTKEVQDSMMQPQVSLPNGKAVGLGWVVQQNLSNGEFALTHTGRNRGQNTVIILLPKSKKGIVVFTNGENGHRVYEKIIATYFDKGNEILARMK